MKKLNKLCEEFHKMDLGGGSCPKCHNFQCGKTYMQKLRERIDAVPQEQKQKLLDGVWSGLKLGEAAVQAGFNKDDVSVYGQILSDNIGSLLYLKKEAVK